MNALLRKIAKELRYHPLTDIIGSRITIFSVETIQADILQAVSPPLPATAALQPLEQRFLIGPLIRYGLLDLTFDIPEPLDMMTGAPGLLILKQLGFVTEPEPKSLDSEEADRWGNDPTCLAALAEDLNTHQFVMRLFLELPR